MHRVLSLGLPGHLTATSDERGPFRITAPTKLGVGRFERVWDFFHRRASFAKATQAEDEEDAEGFLV
jgi:hypothetical protein